MRCNKNPKRSTQPAICRNCRRNCAFAGKKEKAERRIRF